MRYMIKVECAVQDEVKADNTWWDQNGVCGSRWGQNGVYGGAGSDGAMVYK